MSGGTKFSFAFEIYLWKQPHFLVGHGLVRTNSIRPWAYSFYVIVRNFTDYNRSKYFLVHIFVVLKVACQILGRKFYKTTKKSFLYSISLLTFIHRAPVIERHPITREIRDLLQPRLTPTGNTVYFYISSSFIYTLKIHRRSFKHSVR